jgi:GT2 family glycosyltransferase
MTAPLTVVVPTRGRPEILARTLAALLAQDTDAFDVVVVVDGTDQPVPDLAAFGRRGQVLVQDHAGPGAARNRAVAAVDTPLVLFLGDDMVPDPGLVAAHLACHHDAPEAGTAVLGHVVWHDEVERTGAIRWLDRSGSQFEFSTIDGTEAGFGHLYSCNLSLQRDAFVAVGGFDEAFVYYYEDLDLGWRLHEAGMRLRYEPAALARHLHGYDLDRLRQRFAGVARGEHMMASKHAWFSPWFASRFRAAAEVPAVSTVWPRLVDRVPSWLPGRRHVERQADLWYRQQLAPAFLAAFDGQDDLAELQAYLGADYDDALLRGHVAAVDAEEEAAADEREFYRTSRMYLYDLTVFAMSGTKLPYHADLRSLVAPGARLLDWGCGIGADGLRLLDQGYGVSFVDFANPSQEYLRWRLARRGHGAEVYDLERDEIPGGFDLAYSFDVIEHVEDPMAFLAELERRAAIVLVNLLEPDPDDTHLHKPLPIAAILERADERGRLLHHRYHGRSHLVAYRGSGGAGAEASAPATSNHAP